MDENVVWAGERLLALADRAEVRGTPIQTEVLFIRDQLLAADTEAVAWREAYPAKLYDPTGGGAIIDNPNA